MTQIEKPFLVSGTPNPWVIAHRGFSADYPENTRVSFDMAMECDIDAIELDLQWTYDREVVCYHDRTLHKLGLGRRAVRHRTFAQLQELDAGGWFEERFVGEKLMRLEEVLSRYGGKTWLLLEVKRRAPRRRPEQLLAFMEAVLAEVKAHGMSTRVAILCFDDAALRHGWSIHPGVRYVLNQEVPKPLDDDRHLAGYSIRAKNLDAEFVRKVHARNKPVMVFTVNSNAMLKRMLACGVDGIMADDPGWLAHGLRDGP